MASMLERLLNARDLKRQLSSAWTGQAWFRSVETILGDRGMTVHICVVGAVELPHFDARGVPIVIERV